MSKDSSAFAYLESAFNRFLSVEEIDSAKEVGELYRKLSGGCEPPNHTWPSGGVLARVRVRAVRRAGECAMSAETNHLAHVVPHPGCLWCRLRLVPKKP